MRTGSRRLAPVIAAFAAVAGLTACLRPGATPEAGEGAVAAVNQDEKAIAGKSKGCLTCHVGIEDDHANKVARLGCVDCHGGDASAITKELAHVVPNSPWWKDRSTVPESDKTDWLRLNADYVQFVNPGDLRIADRTCGTSGCHPDHVRNSKKSMMAHGGMLFGAVLYNNGSFPLKAPRFGLAYDVDGDPVRIQTVPAPTAEEISKKGMVPFLDPLPRYNVTQMGNIIRSFERGGRKPLEIGNPDREEEPGLPARRLSQRGLGTLLRTDPVWLGVQKTRLLDPVLWMPGTNDHAGDYRHSGCTACHMVYANDRDPEHSGSWAGHGNRGRYAGADPTIPKDESGHPIRHQLTSKIPSSQCMVCHMHPGTNMVTTYYGDLWWDNETDAATLYTGVDPTHDERHAVQERNPEGAAARGWWSDPEVLAEITKLNPDLKNVQFSDYHGHGWLYRKVWKKDRQGNLLDKAGAKVSFDDPDKFKKAVHLKDIHLERGMHCADCHFTVDVHGNGAIYAEPRAATEIRCVDCHGSVTAKANLVTGGPAGGRDLRNDRTSFGDPRFEWRKNPAGGTDLLIQRSTNEKGREWVVAQIADSVDPANKGKTYKPAGGAERPVYNEKARYAKTMRRDGKTWGSVPGDASDLAHRTEPTGNMTCASCHTSWTTSCFGCHLPMQANMKKDVRHYEGGTSRNWTNYNFQVLRDDAYMLAIDGDVTGNRISPARSACAIVVGSQNQNREWLYSQQQTISAEGFSGQAFSTYVPHTVRTTETKGCTDCHISEANDNNAIIAQLLLQGTNAANFMGRYVYVACGTDGFLAVPVTEREEPQAVLGSTLHRDAFPDRYEKFVEKDHRVIHEHHHHGGTNTQSIQLRGEYVYAAEGKSGLVVYDVANIDNKGFSERIVSAPVSPLGQKLYVRTRNAAAVASPSTLGVDPTRPRRPENREGPIHLLYAFLYIADREEGLVMTVAATLLDGDPANNFLNKDLVFNPEGLLTGARSVTVAGPWCYIGCDAGLVILDLSAITLADPTPRVAAVIRDFEGVTSVQVQFRYAFVTDSKGLRVLDVTDPSKPRPLPNAKVDIGPCSDVYLVRTWAFVSAGEKGVAIVDVTDPERPRLDQTFDAGGEMNDVRMVRVGMTNASWFAYVADGVNGLRVLQLTSPETVPQFAGFSPRPKPVLIATCETKQPALAIGEGLDRDRAVDEGGNQLSVFGRIGARPLNLEEQRKFYIKDGALYRVTDEPRTQPVDGK